METKKGFHAFSFGTRTKKDIDRPLLSGKCSHCTSHCKRKNLNIHKIDRKMMIPDHDCVQNHDDSAKSVEGESVVAMLKCICYSCEVLVIGIVVNGDSTF